MTNEQTVSIKAKLVEAKRFLNIQLDEQSDGTGTISMALSATNETLV